MQEELLHIFPLHLRETLQKVTMKENTLEEIRIRICLLYTSDAADE